jgi:hypothetical protein
VQPQAVGGRLAAAAGAGEFLWVVSCMTHKKNTKNFHLHFHFCLQADSNRARRARHF